MLKKSIASCVLIIFFIVIDAMAEEENFAWKTISGKWKICTKEKETYLIETKIKTYDWGYSELINCNSVITTKSFEGITSLKISTRFLNTAAPQIKAMIFFTIENYREFFAFRFTGGGSELNSVQFISSRINDPSKPPAEKWNYIITELGSAKCRLESGREYKAEIAIKGEKAVLLIDGEKILECSADRNLGTGKFGFSCKNASLRIDDVKVYKDRAVIFEDDFSKDSVKRIVVKGTLEKVEK